ncbi:hypothetical protein [Cytobacillus stercorigallinarum]|nr:hypothetical protein [Cytobacillus stercorigallinarum]
MITTEKVQIRLKANTTAGFNAIYVELYGGEKDIHKPIHFN